MKKVYNILFAFSFLIILTLPLLKQISTTNSNTQENRKLMRFPETPKTLLEFEKYPQQLDNYLSDNFGFRAPLINFSNQIYYHVFNEITSSKIIFGKNGFVFLSYHDFNKNSPIIETVCDVNKLNPNIQNYIGQVFTNLNNQFSQQGFETTVAIIPTKSRIYPENLPKKESEWCSLNKPTSIDSAISKINNPQIYYPLEKFKKWKAEFQVYLPSFFHWHGKLPYTVAKDIMQTQWNISPNLSVISEKIEIESDIKAMLMGLEFMNNSVKYNYADYLDSTCEKNQCITPLKKEYTQGIQIFNYKRPITNDKKLVLITDSFGLNIAEDFILGFDEVTLFRIIDPSLDENPDFFKSLLKFKKPTHLLFLFHDSSVIQKAQAYNRLIKKY